MLSEGGESYKGHITDVRKVSTTLHFLQERRVDEKGLNDAVHKFVDDIALTADINTKTLMFEFARHLAAQGYLTAEVPEGYVLVPIEPSEDMLIDMYFDITSGDEEGPCEKWIKWAVEIHKAMIKAALNQGESDE